MVHAPRISDERKQRFIDELRRHGVVRRAAATASPGVRDHASSFYKLRERDAEFRTAWDEALAGAIGDAERELLRMGAEGVVERESYHADGSVKDRTVRRDFRALQLYLAARDPSYRRHNVNEVAAKVEAKVKPDMSGLSDDELEQLEQLLTKAR